MRIDSHTALYGVVGNPIRHSLSPSMHNAAFSEAGLNAVYLCFEAEDPEGCVRGMRALGIKGLSVTIPFKSAVIPCLDEVDLVARKIGAVNTIVNRNGRLIGTNTDAYGAWKALTEKVSPRGKRCLMVGAGGAARAIGCILREKGVDLTVVNRSRERGEALAQILGCPFVSLDHMAGEKPELLIQTTPVGMYPHQDQSVIPEEILQKGMVVMDIVYNPLKTRLLRAARERGCKTIDGLGMLVHQGSEQFRFWTGREPPLQVMRKAVLETLGGKDEGD